jgi:hypothetical protein
VAAWQDAGIDVEIDAFAGPAPDIGARVASAQPGLDAALLVSSARRAPGTSLPSPFAQRPDGRRIPLAWLPYRDDVGLRRFAAMAAHVQRRGGEQRAVALLGQWLPNYLRVSDRMVRITDAGGVRAFRWTGDAITREGMIDALGCGLGVGLYVGHGRPVGWAGYHGVRAHHFEVPIPNHARVPMREPMGAILSLCCRTASRRRVAISYAESLPLLGVAAASFGAVGDTLHTDNTRWAVGVCAALAEGVRTVGELLVRAAPSSPSGLASYRLIGDPLAPLGSADRSVRRASRVRTSE